MFKSILKWAALVIGSLIASFLFFAGGTQIYKWILGGIDVRIVGTEVASDVGLVPGEFIDIRPAAQNGSKRVGAYVFLSVTCACGYYKDEPADMYDCKVNDGWTQVAEDRADGKVTYTYAYGTAEELTVLPAGETTVPLVDGIRFTPYERMQDLTEEDVRIDYDIMSNATATYNADGKTAEEAWYTQAPGRSWRLYLICSYRMGDEISSNHGAT